MNNQDDIEGRIVNLEKVLFDGYVPGTDITRCFKPEKGYWWCLSIGRLMEPKNFFYGDSIGECLDKAEGFYVDMGYKV